MERSLEMERGQDGWEERGRRRWRCGVLVGRCWRLGFLGGDAVEVAWLGLYLAR
jgi:hypothetical protein